MLLGSSLKNKISSRSIIRTMLDQDHRSIKSSILFNIAANHLPQSQGQCHGFWHPWQVCLGVPKNPPTQSLTRFPCHSRGSSTPSAITLTGQFPPFPCCLESLNISGIGSASFLYCSASPSSRKVGLKGVCYLFLAWRKLHAC